MLNFTSDVFLLKFLMKKYKIDRKRNNWQWVGMLCYSIAMSLLCLKG